MAAVNATPPASISIDTATASKGNPALQSGLDSIQAFLNTLSSYILAVTPGTNISPTGPTNVAVSVVGGSAVVFWNGDTSGANIQTYWVWRASAGTRNAPTTPTPSAATRYSSIMSSTITCVPNPTGGAATGGYQFTDRAYTIQNMDPANPARFSYWVSCIDINGIESILVPAGTSSTPGGGP